MELLEGTLYSLLQLFGRTIMVIPIPRLSMTVMESLTACQ